MILVKFLSGIPLLYKICSHSFNYEKQRLTIFKYKTIAHETHLHLPILYSLFSFLFFATDSETSIAWKKLDGYHR